LQVPAGTDILENLHYNPNGTAAVDRVKVGFTVAKQEVKSKFAVLAVGAPRDQDRFSIPPNNPNWAAPAGEVTFDRDTELVWMSPHMHLRGRDMTATLIYPDGKTNILLSVPHYDFNWQLNYHTSVKVPKGSKLRIDAHFDNSANNPFNPNPNTTVHWGDQSWEEMMTMTFGVIVDKDVALTKILKGGRLATVGE
jgi:hypothetical protein